MKKTLSALLAGAMFAGTVPMVSAATTLKDFMAANSIPSQYNIDVNADIEVKQSTDTSYVDGPLTLSVSSADAASFDYKATLFMDKVREAFTNYTTKAEAQINANGGSDAAALLTELDNAPVTGEFVIAITNSSGLILPDEIKEADVLKGFNDATKHIFKEVSRTYTANTMTITVKVDGTSGQGYITKKDLGDNLDSYLADLELACSGVTVSGFGTYNITGAITGYTNIGDDPATAADESFAKITYKAVQLPETPVVDEGRLSATVTVKDSNDNSGNGGRVPSTPSTSTSFTISVEVDGTVIEKKTVSVATVFNPYDLETPTKENHLFGGWLDKATGELIGTNQTFSKTTTIVPSWIPTGDIKIDFKVNGNDTQVNTRKDNSINVTDKDITVGEDGTTINVSNITVVLPKGMKFDGWFTDAECTIPADPSMTVTADTVLYAKTSKMDGSEVMDKENHYAYIIGYPDGTVKPLKNISREEVATIFFRLLKEDIRNDLLKTTNNFTDVDINRWSNNAISTMEGYGLITGYNDNTFRPTNAITRAEFIAMAARFYEVTDNATANFSDTTGHWAEKYIASATEKGWVNGYSDNTFRPDQYITRAEAMTIINNMLDRQVTKEGLHENATQWSDNTEDAWYYYEVLEATNSHKCAERENASQNEVWTECIENYDWSKLEK